jgi:hypothetical protein
VSAPRPRRRPRRNGPRSPPDPAPASCASCASPTRATATPSPPRGRRPVAETCTTSATRKLCEVERGSERNSATSIVRRRHMTMRARAVPAATPASRDRRAGPIRRTTFASGKLFKNRPSEPGGASRPPAGAAPRAPASPRLAPRPRRVSDQRRSEGPKALAPRAGEGDTLKLPPRAMTPPAARPRRG